MRKQQVEAYADFINTIGKSKDLPLEQKIKILTFMADEMYVQDENLLYLEVKQVLKELNDKNLPV